MTMFRKVRTFLGDESGAAAVEYALVLSLVAVACVAALTSLGNNAASKFSSIATTVGAAS